MYEPAEDSFLLAEEVRRHLNALPENKKRVVKILDMGSGSGIQAEACLQAGVSKRDILVADINQEVVSYLKEKDFKAVHSNLFSKIKGKFDLIIFNPPYLPEHSKEKGLDTTGGKKGYETIIRFIQQAKIHLKKGGKIFLLFSSLSKPEIIKQEAKKYYAIKEKANKKLFFEKLFVFELKGKNQKK